MPINHLKVQYELYFISINTSKEVTCGVWNRKIINKRKSYAKRNKLFSSIQYWFTSALWRQAHCLHHTYMWLLAYDYTLDKLKDKEYKLSKTRCTWKLGVLCTLYAFFGSFLRIGVSGTHLAVEWTWFVAEGAWLAWKAFWCVCHSCVVMTNRA